MMSGAAGQSLNTLTTQYNTTQPTYSSHPASPISAPPPPPKPTQSTRPDANRTTIPYQPTNQLSSPPPLPPHPTNNNTYTPHPNQPHQQQSHSQNSNQHTQPTHQIPPPHPQDTWLPPSLPQKSIPDLQHILSTPALLTALAQTHPSYTSSLQPLQSLLSTNVALAQQVSAAEAQLRQLRDQTAQLLLNHTSLQTQWRRKQSEMDDALSPWGPRSMYQRLVSSISEQEAVLKAMHDSFMEGSTEEDPYYGGTGGKASEKEVTEWVRRIREGTTVLEKRREMRARWDEGRVGGWR